MILELDLAHGLFVLEVKGSPVLSCLAAVVAVAAKQPPEALRRLDSLPPGKWGDSLIGFLTSASASVSGHAAQRRGQQRWSPTSPTTASPVSCPVLPYPLVQRMHSSGQDKTYRLLALLGHL